MAVLDIEEHHISTEFKIDPDTASQAPSAAHREYLVKRHGTYELDPLPSADPNDPLNLPAWRVYATFPRKKKSKTVPPKVNAVNPEKCPSHPHGIPWDAHDIECWLCGDSCFAVGGAVPRQRLFGRLRCHLPGKPLDTLSIAHVVEVIPWEWRCKVLRCLFLTICGLVDLYRRWSLDLDPHCQ